MIAQLCIIVAPLYHRPGIYAAWLDGRLIHRASRQPLLDAARALLAAGYDPSTTLVMRHGGSNADSLRATIGAAAKLTVTERSRHGPRFEPFQRWNAVSRSVGSPGITPRLPVAVGHRVAVGLGQRAAR
jgi:hypothetical protein